MNHLRYAIFTFMFLSLSLSGWAQIPPAPIVRVDIWDVPADTRESAQMILWVSIKGIDTQPEMIADVPGGPLTGVHLTALPKQGAVISKADIQCLDASCVDFDALFYFPNTQLPVSFKRRRELRWVEVYTSLDPAKMSYKHASLDFFTVPNGYSGFRMREFLANQSVDFDIAGPLSEPTDGICRGVTHAQPWSGSVQTCLAGKADDGSFIIQIKPLVHLPTTASPFGLPIDSINTAFHATQDVSIWLKVMSRGFEIPKDNATNDGSIDDTLLDISKLPPAYSNSENGKAMIREIENAARFQAVHDRITELWLQKSRARLSQFLSLIKPQSAPLAKNADRTRDAKLMISVLAQNNFPEVTSVVTLIESDFHCDSVSDKEAVGCWQFMAPTGRSYGLVINETVDQRKEIIPATNAAAHLLKDLMTHFKGANAYKLALASYNSGQHAVDRQRIALNAKPKDQGEAVAGAAKDQDLAAADAFAAARNFWDLYTYHLLYAETRNYVVEIMAASYIALHPELAHLDSRLALDRAKLEPIIKKIPLKSIGAHSVPKKDITTAKSLVLRP